MSMHKSSMTMGALAVKSINWMKVLDKELVTDLDDMDLVDDTKSQEKCRRLCVAHDKEIWRAEKSNGRKMQWHFLLMEGLVGQQQLLVSRLVKLSGAAGSEGAKGVAKDQEELKEPQEKGSGGQDGESEGALEGGLEGAPEDAPGDKPENGTEAEDGTEEDAQKKDKGKGKEKAL
ncbi:hypothetical protein ID866_10936 [Astraeus odoratus]|nr:hypothetical protein ID866_10936 [Astraeus odoratus]